RPQPDALALRARQRTRRRDVGVHHAKARGERLEVRRRVAGGDDGAIGADAGAIRADADAGGRRVHRADGRTFEHVRACRARRADEPQAAAVRIDDGVAVRADRGGPRDTGVAPQARAIQPAPADAGAGPPVVFSPETRGGVARQRVVHRVVLREIAVDAQAANRRHQFARGVAAEFPDTARARQAVAAREFAEIDVRLLHQERSARGGAAAADALRLEHDDAKSRRRKSPRDGRTGAAPAHDDDNCGVIAAKRRESWRGGLAIEPERTTESEARTHRTADPCLAVGLLHVKVMTPRNDTLPLWSDTASLPRFPKLDRDEEVDVAIVGAGITGLTAAYLL